MIDVTSVCMCVCVCGGGGAGGRRIKGGQKERKLVVACRCMNVFVIIIFGWILFIHYLFTC